MSYVECTNPDRYRGKQVVTKKWVKGHYVSTLDKHYISLCAEVDWSAEVNAFDIDHEMRQIEMVGLGPFLEVKSDTLCRCTGRCDKRGEDIYTQDIVKVSGATNYFAKVEYDSSTASYWLVNHDVQLPMQLGDVKTNFLEVVGNMVDNPELLTSKYSEEI